MSLTLLLPSPPLLLCVVCVFDVLLLSHGFCVHVCVCACVRVCVCACVCVCVSLSLAVHEWLHEPRVATNDRQSNPKRHVVCVARFFSRHTKVHEERNRGKKEEKEKRGNNKRID